MTGARKPMAKARVQPGRLAEEVGNIVIAAWFKALPDAPAGYDGIGELDISEIEDALREVVSNPFNVAVDPKPSNANQDPGITILIPRPPEGVFDRQGLADYLRRYHNQQHGDEFHQTLGVALLFGCGR